MTPAVLAAAHDLWTPINLAGLKGWYDASDAATITSSAGAVSQWNDKSANGWHVTQAVAGNKPTTGLYTRNGLNTIRFSPNDLLEAATAANWTFMHNGTGWVFGIVYYVVEQSPIKDMYLFTTGPTGVTAGVQFRHATEFLSFPALGGYIHIPFVGSMQTTSTIDPSWKDRWNVGTGFIDADLAVAADRIKLARNLDVTYGANATSSAPSAAAASWPLRLGYDTATNDFRVGELVIATGGETERTQIRDYLNLKWGITSPLNPLDITGLQVWYDSSDDASFTYSSGTLVSQWNDKSGNGQHLLQATPANQPNRNVYYAGKATVNFDGSLSKIMRNASAATLAQPYTIFAVAAMQGVTRTAARILSHRSTNGVQLTIGESSLNGAIYAGTAFIGQGTVQSTGVLQQLSAIGNGATSQVWGNASAGTAGNAGSGSLDLITVGASGNTTNFFSGEIAEILIFNTALSTGDRQSVERYLRAKWSTP